MSDSAKANPGSPPGFGSDPASGPHMAMLLTLVAAGTVPFWRCREGQQGLRHRDSLARPSQGHRAASPSSGTGRYRSTASPQGMTSPHRPAGQQPPVP
jgi:uncharacterized membrane protein